MTGNNLIGPDSDLRPLIGGKTAATMEKALGWTTVDDALRHFPRRYLKRGELTDLGDLRVGEDVTVMAEVASVNSRRVGGKGGRKPMWMTEVVLTDGRAKVMVTFFNQKWRDATLVLASAILMNSPTEALMPMAATARAASPAAVPRPVKDVLTLAAAWEAASVFAL